MTATFTTQEKSDSISWAEIATTWGTETLSWAQMGQATWTGLTKS